ncbi:MAG: hypothetical protein U0930_24620 [Pirellulales bacterium]
MRDQTPIDPSLGKLNELIYRSGLSERAAIKFVDRMEAAFEISTKNLQNFDYDCKQWDQETNSCTANHFEEHFFRNYSPSLSSIGSSFIRLKMHNDLAVLAIAVRQYELANGRLPAQLSDLESQSIDLRRFQCVDGNTPGYRFSENDRKQSNQLRESRATLWSFDPRVSSQNPKPTLPSSPSSSTLNQDDELNRNEWQWEFR